MNAILTLPTPLCRDPRADDSLRGVVQRAVAFLLDGYGAAGVEAVILTGSLARGEASVLRDGAEIRLLGDVEMLVIVQGARWAEVRRRMVELGAAATRQVGAEGRLASIEYAPAAFSYLERAIRPSIFAWDLKQHGKVLWGREDVLDAIPPFTVADIPRENAIELVMNRLLELLMMREAERFPATAGARPTDEQAYQLVKTVLDLAGSALAFAGRYVSSYAERPPAFAALCATEPELQVALGEAAAFQHELSWAAECKLNPVADRLALPDLDARVRRVIVWAEALWRWETSRLLARPADSLAALVDGYLGRESWRDRLRGWTKYYLHPLRPAGALSLARASRLFWRASPRNLAYAAALLSHGSTTSGCQEWGRRAQSLLPVAPPRADAVLWEAGELWRWLVRNN